MEIIYKNQRFIADSEKTVSEVLELASVQEDRLCIFVDETYPEDLGLETRIGRDTHVWIYPELSGRTGYKIGASVVLLAATVASSGIGGPGAAGFLGTAGTVGGQIAARSAILIGGALIATGLQALAPRAIADINGENNQESPTYSLTASGNAFRPFEPFPIIFGEHNIFPDFSSQPYNEYKTYDPTYTYQSNTWRGNGSFTETVVANGFVVVAPITGETFNMAVGAFQPIPALFQDAWFQFSANNYADTQQGAENTPPPGIGDQYRRTIVYVVTCPALPALNGTFVSWEDFYTNGSNAQFFPGPTYSNIENYIYEEITQPYARKAEIVKQIMNFGFGDLNFLQDKIGTTDADDFREYQDSQNTPAIAVVESPTNWIIPQGEPVFSTIPFGATILGFNLVNGNVDTVDGGRLDNQPNFLFISNPNAFPNNWVIRQGPENTFGIQVDIEGRQFGLDKANGGTKIITRYFDFQYRQVLPVVTGWLDFTLSMNNFPIDMAPYRLRHGSSGDVWRDTVWIDNLPLGQYEVRARRRDPNESSADNVSEIYMKRIRFYQDDEQQNYVAQNRKAVIVESDSQLQGALGKLSTLVSAMCWRNDGAGNYTWGTTTNPADWLLFYARGGFKNTTADGTLTYPYSPTVGWINNADHPDNNEQLFGAGISDSRIDFASLTDWWNFCDAANLEFAAVLDRTENVFETFKKICSVGRGSPTWALGKLGVVFENPNQIPVAMFSPENILPNSFEVTYITEDLPDEVIVNFMNRDNNWSQDSVRAQAIGVVNPINTVTVDYWGITLDTQAQREANLLIARQTYQRRSCKFSTDGEGLIMTRGDVILLAHDLFNWDYSSRFLSTLNDGVNLTQIEIDCEIDDTVTSVSIRLPNGNLASYAASILGNMITLIDPFPLTDAPYYLDQSNTVNALSQWPESVPEDFLIFAGNRTQPGRKMRILSITPKSENDFEIECSEEDPGFYAQEFALSGLPLPIQYERVKAEVTLADVIIKGNGKAILFWELDGAAAVSIMISLNGAAPFLYTIGGATHFGNDVELSYSSGDTVVAVITPIYVDTPFAVIPKTVSFTLT